MDDDFFVSNYEIIKSLNQKNNPKFLYKRFEQKCNLVTSKNAININLNKSKNWENQAILRSLINRNSDYGQIKVIRNKEEIEIFDHKKENNSQKYHFIKEKIINNEIEKIYRKGKKFANSRHKCSFLRKNLKTQIKRQNLRYHEDFYVNKSNDFRIDHNFLTDRIISNLEHLVQSGTTKAKAQLAFIPLYSWTLSQKCPNFNTKYTELTNFKKIIQNFYCSICCSLCDIEIFLSNCGHSCCFSCWSRYIESSNYSGILYCCYPNCNENLNLDFIRLFISRSNFKRFKEIWFKKKLEQNNVLMCPGNCGNVFFERGKILKCECGISNCSMCNLESHFPINCEQYKFYKITFENESERYFLAKGKFCPKCKVFIEKDGGCFHMNCICGLEFCWNCLKPFLDKHNCILSKDFELSFYNWEDKAANYSILFFQYRSFVHKTLVLNLDSSKMFERILKNDQSEYLLIKVKKAYSINFDRSSSFLKSIISNLFEIIHEADKITQYLYAAQIFNKINYNQVDTIELSYAKIFDNLLFKFNKIFEEEIRLISLYKIIIICKKLSLKIKMLENDHILDTNKL